MEKTNEKEIEEINGNCMLKGLKGLRVGYERINKDSIFPKLGIPSCGSLKPNEKCWHLFVLKVSCLRKLQFTLVVGSRLEARLFTNDPKLRFRV